MDEDIFVIDEYGNLASEGYIDVSRVYIRDLLDVSNNTRLGLAGGATNIYGLLSVSGSVGLDNTLDVSGAVNLESALNVSGISTLSNNVEISGILNVSAAVVAGDTMPQMLIKPVSTNAKDALLIIRGARPTSNNINNSRLRFENHDRNDDTNHLLGGINGRVTNNSNNTGELRFNTSADGTTETLCVTMDSTNKTTIHGNLQANGDVGVGTSNPNAKFEVIGDISCSGVYATGNIYATGDVTAFYSNTSDERLKTNIETIENPLDIIANIRGVRFNWNDEAKKINEFVDLDKREIGVLAQEVEKELPEVIKEGFSGYKAVRYEKIIAVLIEGMKEQQSKINTLERLVQNLIEK